MSGYFTFEAQEIVARNVKARGYRQGWSAEAFMARNLAKLAEELAEASEHVNGGDALNDVLYRAGRTARILFDDKTVWANVTTGDLEALRKELADIQVVLFNCAATLQEMSGRHFDVVADAVKKSSADVGRGVR